MREAGAAEGERSDSGSRARGVVGKSETRCFERYSVLFKKIIIKMVLALMRESSLIF